MRLSFMNAIRKNAVVTITAKRFTPGYCSAKTSIQGGNLNRFPVTEGTSVYSVIKGIVSLGSGIFSEKDMN
jgi:hypothetical protein